MPGEDTVLRLVNGVPTTGTIEDTTRTYAIDASSVSVGDVVYQVSGVDSKVARADADNASARPPIGVCLSVPTATTAVVVHSGGVVSGMTGLTRGSAYWLDTAPGALTSSRPSSNAYVVGVALSASDFLVCCVPADFASGGSGTITIKDDGQTINTNFTSLNFTGFATITDAGGGAATINIQGGGGTGGPSASGAINTVPTASLFPTTVLASGSVTDTTSALVLKANAHGSSYDVQQILQAAPAAPWRRYFKMEVNPVQKAFLFGGFAIKQSSTGKFTQWILISGGSDLNLEYDQMTNTTSRSSFTALGVIDPTDVYFAIEDDGANFNFYTSPTGIVGTYVLAHTVSRTAWMTDYDLIGFSADAQNNLTPNRDVYAVIEHYSADPPTFVAGTNTAFSTMWNPKALPASPNAKDDEFSDGSVDVKWTEYDPTSILTVTEDSYGLKFVVTDDPGSSDAVVGLRQAIPSSDEFEIVARITIASSLSNYMVGGIFLAEDIATNPTTAPLFMAQLRLSGGGQDLIEMTNYTNRTAWSSTAALVEVRTDTIYLAMQWKASTSRVCVWFSHTGVDWTRLSPADYDPTTVTTASYMGVFANGYNLAGNVRAEFFRVREAASGIINVAPPMQGSRVAVSNGARTGSGTDNQLVRWDGTQNLQGSGIAVDDSGNLTLTSAAAIKITESASAPSTSAGVGALWVKNTTPSSFRVVDDAGTDTPLLLGPASSTNNAIMLWNGTGGTTAKDSNVTITVNDILVGAQGLTLVERGTSPSVSAGQGAYWVRNDTPSAPVFTDDTSTAYHLLNWSPVKRPCRFATTGNIANLATGAPNSVDGVTPVAGNRVLVWNQSTASQNGIYVVNVVGTGANGQWARASDFDEGPNDHIEAGVETYVQEGNAWGGIRFSLATTGTITIGSTSLTFTPEGGLARTDASSTEVIAATAFTNGTFVTSSTIDMRDHSVLAVFFLATSIGSNTQVDIVVFWSDDGTTIPFATDDYLQQTDFNITAQTDGSYYPKPYTARLTTTGGELVANAGVHLSFPKRGGACRIGVKGNNASGSFSVRTQRITN